MLIFDTHPVIFSSTCLLGNFGSKISGLEEFCPYRDQGSPENVMGWTLLVLLLVLSPIPGERDHIRRS